MGSILKDINFITFFESGAVYLPLIILGMAVVYSIFFSVKFGVKSKSLLVSYFISILFLVYCLSVKHLTYHVIAFLFLISLTYVSFFKKDGNRFLNYYFLQIMSLMFSYLIILLLAQIYGNSDGGIYSFIDLSRLDLVKTGSFYEYKILFYSVIVLLLASSFSFFKFQTGAYWFEKSTLYFLGVTKIPLFFVICLYSSNYTLINEVISDIQLVLLFILIYSLLKVAISNSLSSLVPNVNNFLTAMFLIVLHLFWNQDYSFLYQLVTINMFSLLISIVFSYNKAKFLKDSYDKSLIESSHLDTVFTPGTFVGDNGLLFGLLLLPGSLGFYFIVFSSKLIVQQGKISMFVIALAYFVVLIKLAYKVVSFSTNQKKDAWLNRAIYPLAFINFIIIIGEIIWKRLILN